MDVSNVNQESEQVASVCGGGKTEHAVPKKKTEHICPVMDTSLSPKQSSAAWRAEQEKQIQIHTQKRPESGRILSRDIASMSLISRREKRTYVPFNLPVLEP
jgi:hypothetical protein